MTAIASVLTPFDATPAIELGNAWRKRLLPVGEISYQGRTLHFTREYLAGLVRAWQDGAYDQVPLQFADAANAHTNDPERTRGRITSMTLGDDGLYVTAELTERGQRVLQENPYLGVSARIVEQYQRADGKFYPAAIQHVLGTLDPRIPGLGAWQPVDMSNGSDSAITIDLSNYSFAGEPGPALPDLDELSDDELADLLDVLDETGLLDGYGDDGDELSDDELEMLMREAEAGDSEDPFTSFDATFTARAQAEAEREDARAAAIVEDVMHPARRDEDKIARIMGRAAAGLYHGQSTDFASEQAAVELAMATGRGNCGPPDDFGRCSSRFHDLECSHGLSTDWQASGPHPDTYAATLANYDDGLALSGIGPAVVYGDSDDPGEPSYAVPQQTIELAHELAVDWGLDGTPGSPDAQAYLDLLRAPAAPVTVAGEMYQSMGLGAPPQPEPAPSYPGIAELRAQMGI